MKQLTLNFYQRLALWARVGSANAPSLAAAEELLRILSKLRPQEEERREAQLEENDMGGLRFQLPYPSYGLKEIELEDDEAVKLERCLREHPAPIPVRDAEWILALFDELKVKPEDSAALVSAAS